MQPLGDQQCSLKKTLNACVRLASNGVGLTSRRLCFIPHINVADPSAATGHVMHWTLLGQIAETRRICTLDATSNQVNNQHVAANSATGLGGPLVGAHSAAPKAGAF